MLKIRRLKASYIEHMFAGLGVGMMNGYSWK